MEKNYIKTAYLENLERLKSVNSFAYQFLKKLEQHAPFLWVSTHKNLHLYAGRQFLAYIKFTPDHTGIILSSRYNKQIWNGTEDHSTWLFQQCLPSIIEQYHDAHIWALWHNISESHVEVTFSKQTPDTFFHDLYNTLLTITHSDVERHNYWWFGINNRVVAQ